MYGETGVPQGGQERVRLLKIKFPYGLKDWWEIFSTLLKVSGTAQPNPWSLPSILPPGLLILSSASSLCDGCTFRQVRLRGLLCTPHFPYLFTFSHDIATNWNTLFHFLMPWHMSVCPLKGWSGIMFVKEVSPDPLLSRVVISPSPFLLGCL